MRTERYQRRGWSVVTHFLKRIHDSKIDNPTRFHRSSDRTPHRRRILNSKCIGSLDRVKKILAPTDLSENSQWGVRYALVVADKLDAAVTIYYVVTGNEIAGFR